MTRVRACTMRWRCHSSCRRSRFSQLGTQIRGKSSFSSSFENVPSIFAIVLLFAPSFRSDHLGISPPQLYSQLFQQLLKPTSVSTGLHAHTNWPTHRRQGAIELLCFRGMC